MRLMQRTASRAALLGEAALDNGFLLGNVGRMTEQKGLHLFADALDRLVLEGLRLVFVGNGNLDGMVDGWAADHPRAVRHFEYSEELARLIYAGADGYLMPSRFEPCGIGQLYAMRYGCPPLVRLTGGLADTVVDLDEDPDRATGFGFRVFQPEEAVKTVRRAMRLHRTSRREWRTLQKTGMTQDWSWNRAANRYLEVYSEVLGEDLDPGVI